MIETADITETANIAAGNQEDTEIYAPTDATYTILGMSIGVDADADWTSGSHKINLRGAGDLFTQMKGQSDYQTNIVWHKAEWETANQNPQPSDPTAAVLALHRVMATDSTPMRFRYYNDADAPQEMSRSLEVAFERRDF
jgi:hypothetical protein